MALTTPQDIVTLALKACGVLGVGQSALAEDNTDAFNTLCAMIGQWNAKRWLIYNLIDTAFTSTGAQSYTVGPGGNFNIPRATRLEAAFFRQFVAGASSQPVDYPLEILQSREDYNNIALKSLQSWPEAIFMDTGYPLGTVYPVPIPQASIYELHLTFKNTLGTFTSLTQSINMPDEYIEALWTNLACRLPAIYPGATVSPITVALAKASLDTIRVANAQIPALWLPNLSNNKTKYNIFSDRTYS